MNKVLVTGGAGFIGTNVIKQLIQDGCQVTLLDNLSRNGTEQNLACLYKQFGKCFGVIIGDVRDFSTVEKAVVDVDIIFHLAAQVAVTTSVTDPRADFDVNLMGTFNVLEAARQNHCRPTIVFTSTNKVYGTMEDTKIVPDGDRYKYEKKPHGISETHNLDFHSPYGCSKGAADQYVYDYGRIYGLHTIVFRMSCIYGPHQHGNEDQGWIAHFSICALKSSTINIYGDGKQVRDVLFVEDLVDAFKAVISCKNRFQSQVYNVGGGPQNTLSVLELVRLLEGHVGRKIPLSFGEWRPGDQKVYISDIRKIQRIAGWNPRVGLEIGICRLIEWLKTHLKA